MSTAGNGLKIKMSPCETDKKGGQHQARQAFKYLKVRKETIVFYNLFNNLKSTYKRTHPTEKNYADSYRLCPPNVPMYLYSMARPFLTDKEIEKLFRTVSNKIKFFKSDDVQYYADEIIERAFKTLLRMR